MKKGYYQVKRASKPNSRRLAEVLCHPGIATKNLESQEWTTQIFAVRAGDETFSIDTYKDLKRELTSLRNVVRRSQNLTTKKLRTLKQHPKLSVARLFEANKEPIVRKVLDRFRHREARELYEVALFSYRNETTGNGGPRQTEGEFEEEKRMMELKLAIFLQETIL